MLVAVGWSVLLAIGWVVINGDAMFAVNLFGRTKVDPSKGFARRAIIESQVKKTRYLTVITEVNLCHPRFAALF
jgi:hypothetical protein